jgi:hypothetical protein
MAKAVCICSCKTIMTKIVLLVNLQVCEKG